MAGARVAFAGGVRDLPPGSENDPKAVELARFAVAERNNNTTKYEPLEFVRLVKVSELVVAGMLHYFVIEVKEGGKRELYQAKVWEKAWENFKRFYNRFDFDE